MSLSNGASLLAWDSGPYLIKRTTTIGGENPLTNGTPTFGSYVVPNDGAYHGVLIITRQVVTVLKVAGAIQAQLIEGGSVLSNFVISPGNEVPGAFFVSVNPFLAKGGATIAIVQNTALTSGAATLAADIVLLN